MGVVTTAITAAVVAAVGLILAWLGKGQFESLRREFVARSDAVDARFDAVDQRIDRLEERLDRRMDSMQASIDAMRSDLTQVALAVGVRPRATNR
jgi:predicted PurR-regulated permease PerM